MVASRGAGALRERLAFEERPETDDGYGNTKGDWAERFRAAANVRPVIGGENIQAGRLAGVQPFVITIRQHAVAAMIAPDWRARDLRTGALYNIRSLINADQKRKYLEILCDGGGVAT